MQFGKSSGKVSLKAGMKDETKGKTEAENKKDNNFGVHAEIDIDYLNGGFTISIHELITFMTTRWDLFIKLIKYTFKAMPLIREEIVTWNRLRKQLVLDDIMFEEEKDRTRNAFPSWRYPSYKTEKEEINKKDEGKSKKDTKK